MWERDDMIYDLGRDALPLLKVVLAVRVLTGVLCSDILPRTVVASACR